MFEFVSRTSLFRLLVSSKRVLFGLDIGLVLVDKGNFFILKLNHNGFVYNNVLVYRGARLI